MTTQERLIARLREECGLPLPEGTRLRRTYSGRHQRAQGAWRWFALFPDGSTPRWHHRRLELGSHWTMTQLLAADALTATMDDWDDTSIDPKDG